MAAIPLGILAQRLGWIDLTDKSTRGRRGGGGGGLVGIGDEVFSPARYETQLELDRQTILPAPAPLAGDLGETGSHGVYAGRVRIDLRADPRQSDAA